jgi:hypothetical protein
MKPDKIEQKGKEAVKVQLTKRAIAVLVDDRDGVKAKLADERRRLQIYKTSVRELRAQLKELEDTLKDIPKKEQYPE